MLLVAVLAALLVLAAIGFGLILFSFFLMMQAKKAKAARGAARAATGATPAVAPAVAPPPPPAPRPSAAPPPVATPLVPPDPSASGMRRPPARGAGYADDDELQATVVMAAGATSWLDDGADGE